MNYITIRSCIGIKSTSGRLSVKTEEMVFELRYSMFYKKGKFVPITEKGSHLVRSQVCDEYNV